MTSPGALREFRAGPLYFFDQPTGRDRAKGTRINILHFNLANEGARLAATTRSNPESGSASILDREAESEAHKTQRTSYETCGGVERDTSPAGRGALKVSERKPGAAPTEGMEDNPVDAYKHAAPQVLKELAFLLSQHKWTEKGRIPRGLVNVLNYSWQDLTAAAAMHLRSPGQTDKLRKSKAGLNFDETLQRVSVNDKKKTEKRQSVVVGNAHPSERKTQEVHSSLRIKKTIPNAHRGVIIDKAPHFLLYSPAVHASTTISFSISSKSCKEQGWIIQPKKPSCDEPQQATLCQWVVERLQMARIPIKLQTAKQVEQGLNKPAVLRHYGDAKPCMKDKRTRAKAWPVTLVNGMPRIPEVKQEAPARQKLHYRINDGSSVIYYPSGRVAVCQSHSGLPHGGYYTNVFGDAECPVILASVTAFGHGAVTHPVSGTITAAWNQDGGLICDSYGTVTKEWTWQTGPAPKERIVIQLSDLISVRLFSGTSAILSFRSDSESVQLPVSALSNVTLPKETPCLQTEERFADAAQELQPAKKRKHPVLVIESKRDLALTSVPLRSLEVHQMVREVERLEEPPVPWRGGGHAGRELRRLQQRVRNTLDDWLEYYRRATGIKCPDIERMPDAPLRTRPRREVQSAALPSVNPPEQEDTKPRQPEEGRNESQDLARHLSAPDFFLGSCSFKLPRTPKKRTKEESHVTQIGTLRLRSNVRLDSVIIPRSPELQPPAVIHCPVQMSVALSPCPALLRAALLGEQGRRLCCCSSRLMPLVTDVEYDAFVMGQPPHSEQILVVCVTPPRQPVVTHTPPDQDALEEVYEKRNRSRTMPCTQCQMDSFRLVKYEMSTEKACCGAQNTLLQHRHNAAPGMVLMYIRGKLLFADYIFNGYGCSVRDFHKQISRTRGDYRLGLILPPDYKFSVTMKSPAARDSFTSQEHNAALTEGETPGTKKTSEKKTTRGPEASLLRQIATYVKANTTPAVPPVPVVMH